MSGLPIVGELIKKYEESLPYADGRTRQWFLVWNTPIYVWSLTITYLSFVWLGPKFMKNRQPFDLSRFMLIYNLALVCLSTYMFIEMLLSTSDAGYEYICSPYNQETRKNPKELRVANVMWWYYFSKAIELMDTVLMVLRKRMRQVTFLHVFHHATMLNIWWWVMMFIPGGQSWFGSCLNCLVHVVMYSYYGLSVVPALQKKLWWKRYITRFQLIQFAITLSHTLSTMYTKCDFPVWGQYLLAGYMMLMLTLFANFYMRAYIISLQVQPEVKHKDLVNGHYANGLDVPHEANGHMYTKKHA